MEKKPIYFAADFGLGSGSDLLMCVINYFDGIEDVLTNETYNPLCYRIGVYGAGQLLEELENHFGDEKYIYTFLPAAQGYEGYSVYKSGERWNILQGYPKIQGGYYDTNETSSTHDFGGWVI